MADAKRDDNRITTLLAVSNVDGITPVVLWADPTTHRLLVSAASSTHNFLSATHADTVAAAAVLGDIVYGDASPDWTKLAGNTTATKKFLTQTGNGAISAIPAWATLATGDIPDISATYAVVAQTFYIGTTQVAINRASAALTLAGLTLTTPDIGTPSAGTLTSCSGLPLTGLVDDTTTALGVGTLELGHATDTTLARVSAGLVSIEGNNILTATTGLALAGGTMTGDIQLGETDIKLDAVLSADEKWSGITIAGTAGATLAVGDICFLQTADSKWELVDGILDGTDLGFKLQLGICVLAANADAATEMLVYGKVRSVAFPAFTVGAPVYLSDIAGDLTSTQPSTTNFAIRVCGYGVSAEELFFCPSPDYIVHI